MASSSNLLRLLPLAALLAAVLLPCIRCDNNTDLVISQCERVDTSNQPNPTYADKMISDLLTLAPENGFAYAYHDPAVYGLAWCRGDFSAQNCSACLAKAAGKLVELCSHDVVAARLVFQDFCYLRLDIEDFLPKVDVVFGRILLDNRQIVAEHQSAYWASVGGLLDELTQAIPQQEKRFGRSKVGFDLENLKIYGMGQCLQGNSRETCSSCLEKTKEYMMERCDYDMSCEIFVGSCFLKYYAKKA